MINIEKKDKCCGCSACVNICPKQVIKMIEDEEGFLYPKVDKDSCVNCGLCNNVCPMNNNFVSEENKSGFIIKSKEKIVRRESSSGGFFTAIAKSILNEDGYVYGAAFTNNFSKCEHIEVDNINEINKLRGSKYVQSDISKCFKNIKDHLINSELVCFSGTSCQINAIVNYLNLLKINTENLILVDLVCHGVSSPEVWKQYKNYMEKKYKGLITYTNFRYKTYGYHSGTMKLVFDNGKKYYGSGRVDFMLKSFFSEINSRYSCYNCNFKERNRLSDITIFDGWHYSQLTGNADDDLGYTNVILNTEKGKKWFEKCNNDLNFISVNVVDMIKYDGIMYDKSAKPHEYRSEFLQEIKSKGLESQVSRYIPISMKDKMIEKMKNIYYFRRKIK